MKNTHISSKENTDVLGLNPVDLQKHIQKVAQGVHKKLSGAVSEEVIYDALMALVYEEKKRQRKLTEVMDSPKLQSILHSRIMDIPDSEVTSRTKESFLELDIKLIGDVCVYEPKELRKLPGIGPRSIEDIQRYVGNLGLSLGLDLESFGFKKNPPETRKVMRTSSMGVLDLLNGGVRKR